MYKYSLLHQRGVNLGQKICHIQGYQGLAPVHIATHLNRVDVLNILGVLGISLDIVDNYGLTPACIAAVNNNPEVLIALHQLGIDLNKKINFYGVMAHRDYKGRAPIHIATVLGHIPILQTLKNLQADLNAFDDAGLTPGCIAVLTGNLDELEELHRLGADLSIRAIKSDIVSLVHAFVGCAPVHMAIMLNKKDVLQKLKDLGYSLDEYNLQGDTPACMAARTNNVPMLRALFDLGADINRPNAQGFTPGCLAAKCGNRQILKELKALNLLNANPKGATSVYTAAKYGRSDSIKTLHKLGEDFNTPNGKGKTPVFIAAQKGHTTVLKWLKEYGANLNTPDYRGYTPAYIALATGQLKTFNLLREWGADLSQVRDKGEELWQIAAEKQDTKMLSVLIDIDITPPKVISRTSSPAFFAEQTIISPVLRMASPISRPNAPPPCSVLPMDIDEGESSADALPERANQANKRPAIAFLGGTIAKKAKTEEPQNPEEDHGCPLR